MLRLSQGARLFAGPLQQRKLLAILLLWACLCFVILRSQLPAASSASSNSDQSASLDVRFPSGDHLAAKRAASSLRPPGAALEAEWQAQGGAGVRTNVIDSTSESGKRLWVERRQQPAVISSSVSASLSAWSSQRHRQHDDTNTPSKSMEAGEPKQQQQQAQYSTGAAYEAAQCQFEYPSLIDLQFNNIYWQKLTTRQAPPPNVTVSSQSSSSATATPASAHRAPTQATFYLYNAYYDDRWRAGQPSVRVLAMIDRVEPPPTDCLLWSRKLGRVGDNSAAADANVATTATSSSNSNAKLKPIVVRAQFVYAWYPKWGNYEDGLLQPWIVTCPLPGAHAGLVPDSVSLVEAPRELIAKYSRAKRQAAGSSPPSASVAMPPAYSSSSSSSSPSSSSAGPEDSEEAEPAAGGASRRPTAAQPPQLDCNSVLPISNNLPVQNKRPPAGAKPHKFAVCVKGLDFPYDDVSVRLVEWIELLNLLGAKKIFLYQLAVHKNISRVLDYYQQRGIVELSPLTLPGEQPNLADLQHLYLKQHLTAKRQNELIPYNDCLYRNLYSYKYLALLDIDEVIMPLKGGQNNWYDLMEEVERLSLAEQNYSRASYNVRNVYFFDDLSGPLGTTQSLLGNSHSASVSASDLASSSGSLSAEQEEAPGGSEDEASTLEGFASTRAPGAHRDSAERGIPHYLHMMSHVYRSKNYTEPGQYVKCFHNTERAVSLHNHFPMNCFGQCTTYSIPVELAHLQHYRKDCVGPLRQSCKNDFRHFTTRDTTIWKYKQRMIKRTTRVLDELGLLSGARAGANRS